MAVVAPHTLEIERKGRSDIHAGAAAITNVAVQGRVMRKSGRTPRRASLTHLDSRGRARMVDVSPKSVTLRRASATADVSLSQTAWDLLRDGRLPKGDALAVARIAGIQAAKRTAELIPLCHALSLESVTVEADLARPCLVRFTSNVTLHARTGAEMEALTAVSVAALALYDMCKAVDRAITIGPIRLVEKSGGRSGRYMAPPHA